MDKGYVNEVAHSRCCIKKTKKKNGLKKGIHKYISKNIYILLRTKLFFIMVVCVVLFLNSKCREIKILHETKYK